MKTMKKEGSTIRVKEDDVKKKLSEGYFFCPKKEWKDTRGHKETPKEDPKESIEKDKKEKKSKKK